VTAHLWPKVCSVTDQSDRESAVESSGDVAGDVVRLWDGRDYDPRWLAVEFPELLAYADGHATFRETCPISANAVAKAAFIGGLASMNAILIGPVTVIVGVVDDWTTALVGFAILNGIFLLVTLLFTAAHFAGFRRRRLRVAVRSGHVWVYQVNSVTHRWRIDEIEWYFGKFSESSIFDKMWLPRVPVIVLATPDPLNRANDETLGVGFTQEAHNLWQQLLTVAGQTRRTAWEPRPWTWRRAAQFAVGIGLIPIILATGAIVLIQIKEILLVMGVQKELAVLAVMPPSMLTVLLLLVHLGHWPWKGLKRVPGPLAPEELRRARRRQFPLSCVPCFGFLVLVLLVARGIPLAAKAPILLGWTPILLLVAWWITCQAVPPWVWQKTLEPVAPTPIHRDQPSAGAVADAR
jgi:hypothetical protein